ncbi:energy transducer TonB [Vibrio sp. SNU_ST1]|uniref:energy transducer TonB n=1 Tax=Vibrio sp. SNU_ST1 TaxID=3064001 RepID=UPI00272C42F3|nr:energy transducer TonB [Vibrio sp. SNU_ST1]WKY60273.1 energy transducer TonB [Vibrio sp. SNU_ST1]
MNVPRYVIAGGASLVIHAAMLFVAQESKVFAMPAGSQSNTVSINFTPKSVPSQAQQKTVTQPVEPEPIKEMVSHPEPKPVEPKAVEPKQAKPAPKKKAITNKPQPKKVEKKVVEKTVEKKPIQKKPVTQPKKLADKKVDKNMDESANQPRQVNQGVSNQEPVLVTRPSFSARPTPPSYPRQARRRGVEGVATYEVWLDAEGKQIKQALVNSSGALMLDNAALKAIKKWKFSPHTVNGRAIAHRVQIPVRFKLD